MIVSILNISKMVTNIAEKMPPTKKRIVWHILDSLSFLAASVFSYLCFYKLLPPIWGFYLLFGALMFAFYILIRQGTHQSANMNRYNHTREFIWVSISIVVSALTSALICDLLRYDVPYRYVILNMLVTSWVVLSTRILWQKIYKLGDTQEPSSHTKRNILLVGAGDGGAAFMESYFRNPGNIKVIGIIDKDPLKKGRRLRGVPVLGYEEVIPQLSEQYSEIEAIIAIPSLKPDDYVDILNVLNKHRIKSYKMPKVEDVLYGDFRLDKPFKKVEIADLLGRKEVSLNTDCLKRELEGKTILVTGAGGSIGSEICRQVIKNGPKHLLLLGHGENSIYLIYHELIKLGVQTQITPIIADIQDYSRLLDIFKSYPIDIVYHAAAHKHVPLMEINPTEAFKNNIIGTYNVAKAVDAAEINKMVLISSDKAVNPPNVMGATKRIAELIVTGFGQKSRSTFCAVRFGNVLGSRGSVIPVFESQIRSGGPITVTDFRMTRYFMTIPEASQLVINAGAYAQGGEVFILDMGEPVKIVDLARKLIVLSGHLESEIEIIESGIRPGEKLFEELLLNSEIVDKQVAEKIFVGKVKASSLDSIETFIEQLRLLSANEMKEKIIAYANNRTN